LALPYLAGVATDLWLGAATTLIGAALGGSISFIVSRQQIKSAWMQREADAVHERNRRSEDRRFAAYSEFITHARSFRNALRVYYQHSDNRPSIKELDALLQVTQDSSTLVFLLVASEEAYQVPRRRAVSWNCLRHTTRVLSQVAQIIRGLNLIRYLGDLRATSKTLYELSSG
jgi:hypothetical protein